jgi:anti-sigma regulatory factor (Ser/Thr protein kinase)
LVEHAAVPNGAAVFLFLRGTEIAQNCLRMTDGGELKLSLARSLPAARGAVMEVRRFLEAQGVKGPALEDCELALAEACNNAVLHNSVAGNLALAACMRGGAAEFRLIDEGPGYAFPENATLPPPDSESGRGLYLIKSLMDEARLERHGLSHELILRKRVSE